MRSLVWTIAPVGLCLFLPMLGCTGVGPHNWAQVEQPYHASRSPFHFGQSPMLADAQHEMPVEPRPQNRLLARGMIREHWLRARGYEQVGETEQAAAHYQEILRLEPRYAPAHHRLGVLATMWGRFGDADQHFRLARLVNKPEISEEELYAEKSATSEKEAEARLAREIAAEKSAAARLAREQGYSERAHNDRGYTRHSLPEVAEGETMDADEYYAQSERPLQQFRKTVRRRTSEWMAPVTSRVAGRMAPDTEAYADEEVRSPRSRIVRDGDREYYPDEEETYYDEEEVESDGGPQYRRALKEPTFRRTSAPAGSSNSNLESTRSTQLRTNILREEGVPPRYMAGAEEREPDARTIHSEHAAATSGIRRRTEQDSDRFDEELPPRTIAQRDDEAIYTRASLPEAWEAEARVEERGTIVRTEATMTEGDQSIARKAAEIEAAIERNVQEKVSATLAERRIDLAREQLHRAQQHLVEAMLAAEQAEQAKAKSGSLKPAVQTELEPAPRARLPLPAPRRLRSQRTSAVEMEDDLELAKIEAELLEIQEATERINQRLVQQAAANVPAVAGEGDLYEDSSSTGVVQTSHLEEIAEPIEHHSMRELYEHTESVEPAATPKRIIQSELPMARAHQPERTVRSLDETTLHRREIQPGTSFQKKAPEAAEIMLYR